MKKDLSFLRKKAERFLSKNPSAYKELESREIKQLVEELHITQIELELQNEELCQAQLELIEERDKYCDLYDNAPVGYFTISNKGIILAANLKSAKLLGVDRIDLINKRFSSFIFPDDLNIFYRNSNRLLKTFDCKSFELRLKNLSGKCFHVRMDCEITSDNQSFPSSFRAIISDISYEKKVRKELQDSKEVWEKTFNTINEVVTIHDKDLRLIRYNQATIRTFGWKHEDLIGKTCYELFCGRDKPCIECPDWHTGQNPQNHTIEVENLNKGKTFLISTTPIYGNNGEFSGLIHCVKDVTEQKRARIYLQHNRKMESLGILTGGVAHDFNNILEIIIGNSEIALEDISECNSSHSAIQEIWTASQRAKDIVRQLLSFSRKSKNKMKPIAFIPILKDAIVFSQSMIPRTIEVEQKILADKDIILSDSTLIHQIIVNLLMNASQAMEKKGGMITVVVENSFLLDGDYPNLKKGNYLKIIVSDTGPGIDPKIIDKIFDPYFTTKEIGGGTGMGLAVVHSLVKNSNGAISVESKPSTGTIFDIFLPLVNTLPEPKTKSTKKIQVGNERILFIDDEESIINLGSQMLNRIGYSVVAETNPQKALNLFRDNPNNFDLIISDMTMPQMSGLMLAEQIKKVRNNIPIIILTGYNPLIDDEIVNEKKISAYIFKPFDKFQLSKTIRRVLESSS